MSDTPPTPHQEFYRLASELGEVLSELEPLKHQEAQLRERIGLLVAEHGTQQLANVQAAIASPGVRRSISVDAVLQFAHDLHEAGLTDWADRLHGLIQVSAVAGSLRITWRKR